ncbi:MAG: DUF6152 family protein [Gammaproteobacteria bacterium]
MSPRYVLALIALPLTLLSFSLQAHHSTAVFALDKMIELRGVIVDFKLRSPHSSLIVDGRAFVDGKASAAGVERWEIEWEALPPLRTAGVEATTFKPGDTVTIMGSPHRDANFHFIHAQALTAANGQIYSITKTDRLYSPSLSVLTAAGPAAGIAIANSATGGIKSVGEVPKATGIARFAGRWQQPFTPPGTDSALPLNAAGVAARNAYDQKASPANTCEPMSIPDIFNAPFYLFEVKVDGQRVVLHNEAYEIVRTVTLGGAAAPVDPKGQFGTATARLDGDALVVESRGYPASKWGLGAEVQLLGGGKDIPSSPQKAVTERYTVTPDGRTLVLDYIVNDPAYMTKPYTGRLELTRVPEATALYPYQCDLESAAMWSRNAKDKALKVGQ